MGGKAMERTDVLPEAFRNRRLRVSSGRKLALRCSQRAPEVCKHRAICSFKESHTDL